jgi:hypothetical protein
MRNAYDILKSEKGKGRSQLGDKHILEGNVEIETE